MDGPNPCPSLAQCIGNIAATHAMLHIVMSILWRSAKPISWLSVRPITHCTVHWRPRGVTTEVNTLPQRVDIMCRIITGDALYHNSAHNTTPPKLLLPCRAFNCRILYGRYLPTVILTIIGIPSPTHSFIPGLKASFSANPSHRSLLFLLQHWLWISVYCLLLLLSISVFSVLHFLVVGSVR